MNDRSNLITNVCTFIDSYQQARYAIGLRKFMKSDYYCCILGYSYGVKESRREVFRIILLLCMRSFLRSFYKYSQSDYHEERWSQEENLTRLRHDSHGRLILNLSTRASFEMLIISRYQTKNRWKDLSSFTWIDHRNRRQRRNFHDTSFEIGARTLSRPGRGITAGE